VLAALVASLLVAGSALALTQATFAQPVNYEAGYYDFSSVYVDINNNGTPDLVLNDLSVLEGNSDGTFKAVT
jgi:hypothetical protein